jgi:hypothetical protein
MGIQQDIKSNFKDFLREGALNVIKDELNNIKKKFAKISKVILNFLLKGSDLDPDLIHLFRIQPKSTGSGYTTLQPMMYIQLLVRNAEFFSTYTLLSCKGIRDLH